MNIRRQRYLILGVDEILLNLLDLFYLPNTIWYLPIGLEDFSI